MLQRADDIVIRLESKIQLQLKKSFRTKVDYSHVQNY